MAKTSDPVPPAAPLDDLATWVQAYREATANAKTWAEIADRAKEQITAALDQHGAQVGTIGGRPAVRWTVVESSRLDTRKLRSEHPELVEAFTVPTVTRRFTVVTEDGQ